MLSFIWDGTNQTVPGVCSVISIVEISHAVCFTIITSPTRWLSVWISNIKNKMGEDCILFSMFCSSGAMLSCLLFSGCQTKKRGEMEWEGSWKMGGVWVGGGMEEPLTCTCLQSLRIHCTIHLLCLFCHGWGQSDQTPIRFLILSPPPYTHTHTLRPCSMYLHPPHSHPPPNTSFFIYVTCWLKERQGNSWASPNGEMSERDSHQNHVVMEMQESPEITDLHTCTQIQ